MPLPMVKTTFYDINSYVHNAYVENSHKPMTNAACEVHKHKNSICNNNNNQTSSSGIVVNTKVSRDGA